MKILYFIIGLLIAGGMGYIFEPQVRYALTGIPGDVKIEKPKETKPTKAVEPKTREDEVVVIDLSAWTANQLPEKVVLTEDVELASEAGDFKAIVKAGTSLNLDEINGQNVKISSGAGGLGGEVPISQTDLIQQLVDIKKSGNIPAPEAPDTTVAEVETPEASESEKKPFDPFGEGEKPKEGEGEVAATEPTTEPTTEEATSTEPEVAENTEDTASEPEEAVAEPKPAETETVETNANVVAVMQASIRNRDIQEFTAEQVTEWSSETTVETIDGEVYGIGMLSYKAQTVFGEKIIQAKALIQKGKVVRWVWPKSGMKIK